MTGFFRGIRGRLGLGPPAGRPSPGQYLRHPGVQQIAQDDGAVLVVPLGGPVVLNPVGASIWNELAEPRGVTELIQAIVAGYDVDATTARRDVESFLGALGDRGLVLTLQRSPKPTDDVSPPGAPRPLAVHDLIPDDLAVRVYAHRAASQGKTFECWTFVSDGLAAVGQKEIALTVRRDEAQATGDYPRKLLVAYAQFHLLARAGRTVDLGDLSNFGARAELIGKSRFSGIVYSTPQPFDGVPIPDDALAGIMLTDDEVQVAERFGAVRMTTLLGRAYRHFPCPAWAERDRQSLVAPAAMEHSVLGNVPVVRVPGVVAALMVDSIDAGRVSSSGGAADEKFSLENYYLSFEAPVAAHERIEKAFATRQADHPLAILTTPDPRADSILLWDPGSADLQCIGARDRARMRVGVNFVLFVPHGSRLDVAALEDGAVVRARGATWARIRVAILQRKDHHIPMMGDSPGLRISWVGGEG